MKNRVSIVVPVYNSAKYLEKIIEQLLNQTYKELEIIFVDDGSSDNSDEIIKKYEEEDKRIRYIYQDNSGPSKARNTGIDFAQGEYLTFVDSDDSVESTYIEKLYEGIVKSKADVCCCGYTCLERENQYTHNDYYPVKRKEQGNFLEKLFEGTGGTTWGKIYRTEIIKSNDIKFDERYRLCEDQLFALEVFLRCKIFSSIDYNGYYYNRLNENSLVNKLNFEEWKQQLTLLKVMEDVLKVNDIPKNFSEQLMIKKFQNVIINLARNGFERKDERLFSVLKETYVQEYLKKIKIKDKYSLLYVFPLKTKNRFLIKIVYAILSKKNDFEKNKNKYVL